MTARLTPEEISTQLPQVPAWHFDPDGPALTRELAFADFSQAFAFMTQVALMAERMDHHPDWHNVYNRVSLRLSTHDVGGLSERDFRLAAGIDRVLAAAVQPSAA